MTSETRILLGDIDVPDIERLEIYVARDGYRAARRAFTTMTPVQVADEVAAAGLRQRCGDWLPLGEQLRRAGERAVTCLCANAHQSEPGSYRDRRLVERHPHQFLEGTLIAARAAGASQVRLCLREVARRSRTVLERAVEEVRAAGLLEGTAPTGAGALEMRIDVGGEAAIAQEPRALLRWLEGRRPEPDLPGSDTRLFGEPVLVVDAGTLAYLPHVLNRGAAWFRTLGTAAYPGTCVFGVSGHVRRPGLYELELGSATLRELVEECAGGVRQGHRLKGVLPGGTATPVLREEELDVRLAPEDWAVPGGGPVAGALGDGSVVVMDDTTCMVDAALTVVVRAASESCGQCPACREGSRWLVQLLQRLEQGRGSRGDLALIESVAAGVAPLLARGSSTLCGFGAAFSWPVLGYLRAFRAEFEQHLEAGACPVARDLSIKVPETVSVRF